MKFAKSGIKTLIVNLKTKYGFSSGVGGWQNYPTCCSGERWRTVAFLLPGCTLKQTATVWKCVSWIKIQ